MFALEVDRNAALNHRVLHERVEDWAAEVLRVREQPILDRSKSEKRTEILPPLAKLWTARSRLDRSLDRSRLLRLRIRWKALSCRTNTGFCSKHAVLTTKYQRCFFSLCLLARVQLEKNQTSSKFVKSTPATTHGINQSSNNH